MTQEENIDSFNYKKNEIFNALVAASSQGEVILVIEDCQEMDKESKTLLPLLLKFFFP